MFAQLLRGRSSYVQTSDTLPDYRMHQQLELNITTWFFFLRLILRRGYYSSLYDHQVLHLIKVKPLFLTTVRLTAPFFFLFSFFLLLCERERLNFFLINECFNLTVYLMLQKWHTTSSNSCLPRQDELSGLLKRETYQRICISGQIRDMHVYVGEFVSCGIKFNAVCA